jgi:SAM-dependent methyltransferase
VIRTGARQDDWDRHWTEFSESATRNPAQAMRRRLIHGLLTIRGTGQGSRVLDIGCGKGDLAGELASLHPDAQVHGIDSSRRGIDLAAQHVPGATFDTHDLLAPGSPPPERTAWATHAVCSEVLEHVDDPRTLLTNARMYLAPGCRLVVTVPGGPMSAFDRHIGHRRHFTVDSLRLLLTEAGFAVETVTGGGFPFFNLYRLAVISRGERLVQDAVRSSFGSPSRLARLASRFFGLLLAVPQPRHRWGWQLVAVARVPDARDVRREPTC